MLNIFSDWFNIFFGSMIPWIEARYIIPFAIDLGMEWWQVFPVVILGNIIPVPFILLFFKYAENFLRNFSFWSNILNKLFNFTRKRADDKIIRFEHLGLLLFVAIPLPFTGAWTGSLIAYLFNLSFIKSLITIFIGIIIAAGIMTIITLSGLNIIIIIIGIIIAAVVMIIVMIIGVFNEHN